MGSEVKTETYIIFNNRAKRELEPLLEAVRNLVELSWEFTDDMLTAHFKEEKIEFTHWKSATAYLSGFLDGWNVANPYEDKEDLD